ncbi:condensin subunit Smc [Carnobacterium iners]|uniref:Chromosome partition protein Smc n=1 Tax=Carnobacterium iners TaxID=1073423 RepID=A0A1X7NL81_9LACT|nr:chromosome segregation protein SMC [Carnobacterium iners]SEK84249.1 condensin subunit Smc [Carnobacterium iners]SMH37924.1 condensin subunit Smc [Carnobacterium iners]
MQLKRIEITGFKSFAEKTIIDFHEGVTAVVGPNGSGKSNITEAIRWVLGEQSAKSLRGGKMNDIIFAGTDLRKPLNFAEVTLVLENEDHFLPLDFAEINITRRLHRNGDSEFFINKQACRLKDIVELFMDSGLGKESFSIISQGKVETIFNSKPEDRRSIFEEAAGVFKYKTRKKKAEQKLAETEDNLSRVQDIIYELDSQIEPLKIQSSIAKDYLLQKKQLSDVEIALTVVEIEQLKKQAESQNQEVDSFNQQLNKMQKISVELEKELLELKNEKNKVTEIIDSEQNSLMKILQHYEQLEGKKQVLNERSKHTKKNRQQHEQQRQLAKEKVEQLTEELKQVTITITKKSEDQKIGHSQLKKAQKEQQMLASDSKEIREQLRSNYIDLMQEQTSLRNEQNYLEKSLNQVSQKKMKSTARIAALELEKEQSEIKLTRTTSDMKAIQQEIAEKILHYQEQQVTVQDKRVILENENKKMFDALRVVQQAKAKKESLQELTDDYTGFYQGVKEILKHKVKIGGVVGAVAELISVPKESEIAIDIALGAASQNIIVRDETSARNSINFLKQKRSGRATFLPLTTIKSRHLPLSVETKVKNSAGFIGIASEVVGYPKEISSIIQNLLGTTIVARDLESANSIAKMIQFSYRVVTLEGDVMNAGGSMTGGASKKGNQSSLFSRKNELATLSKQIDQMENKLLTKETEVQQLKQTVIKEEEKLEKVRELGEQQRLKDQELKNAHTVIVEKFTRLVRELKGNRFEEQEERQEENTYVKRLEAIKKESFILKDKMDQTKRQIEMVSSQDEEREKLQATILQKVQELMTSSATIKEQMTSLKNEHNRIDNQLEIGQKEVDKLRLFIQEISQSNGDQKLSESDLIAKSSKLKKEKEQVEHSLILHKEKLLLLQERLNQVEQTVTLKNNQQLYVVEQKTKVEVSVNRNDVRMDNRLVYLSEEYNLTFESAKQHHTPTIKTEEAAQKVKLLKLSIQELGHVNLGAIEEFERIYNRYTFLVEQRDDLLGAKESLYETMNEMDEEVILRFTETFNAIRFRFSKVFPQMFGGGMAELRLTDPENVLTTGIEIIVQPPGKKLQQLSLLSGGERAFTAIALLFAIIQVRPVPFCILDEVEAALDEANVVRFGRYLNEFDRDTQFIVITHRKGTMEEADVLYGVTMQESGVSKIVSVRLEEAERGSINAMK